MRTIIGVMGGGVSDHGTAAAAERLGSLIAAEGWVLLNGGRAAGVMDASARGAQAAGGLTIGVLPDTDTSRMSEFIDIPILTGMGDARNVINVLSSNIVIAMRGSSGTVSEVALALNAGRPVIMLDFPLRSTFPIHYSSGQLIDAATPEEAVSHAKRMVDERVGNTIAKGTTP